VFRRIQQVCDTRRVVVLASGDPCFFGIGPLLAERFGRERVEIVPRPSSVSLAFARLGVSWQDARVVSAHGRPLAHAVAAAHGATKLAVLTDDVNTPSAVARALLAAGAEDGPAWVFEHLGGSSEAEHQSTLSTLVSQTFASLNILVMPTLSWEAAQSRQEGFGLPESAYAHTASLITKPEVRAVSLSKLRLRPGGVLWDVGAGSGSLTVEAAGLVPDLAVYAIERSETQLGLLRQNVSMYGSSDGLTIVPGEAPDALASLPDPDAVFVGGSGGRLVEILNAAHSRLRSSGRIVANLVTYEHIAAVLAWAQARQIAAEVVQVGIARSATILDMTRLQAENPVTIVTLMP
jgi:precorrin-6Y C5,15-methyltransferase (decarboxylating)